MQNNILSAANYKKLATKIGNLIEQNQQQAKALMRNQLALTYWEVGKIISQENLTQNANYRSLILEQLSLELSLDKSTLTRCIQFFQSYPEKPQISNLTWSHYRQILAIKDENLRVTLEEEVKNKNWNVAKLNSAIQDSKTTKNKIFSRNKLKRPTNPSYLYRAKIINVIDGDTILVNIDLGFKVIKEQRVRLSQINAPEMKTNEGKKSFQYLRDFCASLNEIVIKTNKIDIYGRYLGDVFYSKVQGTNKVSHGEIFQKGIYLNQQLVSKGFAQIF